MSDPVLAADAVEEHFDWWFREPAGEHLAVVGEDLVGDTMTPQRRGEHTTHCPCVRGRHEPRRDTESGVIIDAGEDLDLRAVTQTNASHHIHLPQLHRSLTFPTDVVRSFATPRPRHEEPVSRQ